MDTAIMGTTMRKRHDEFSRNYHDFLQKLAIIFLQKLPFKISFC